MNNATPEESNPSYPFTAEELWQKLKQIIQMSGNDLTGDKIEQIFNIKFPPLTAYPVSGEKGSHVLLSTNQNWNYWLGFSVKAGRTSFGFSFEPVDEVGGLLPSELCMNAEMARKDIIDNTDWKATLPWSNPQFSGKPGARLMPPPPPPLVPDNEYSFFRETQGKVTETLYFRFDLTNYSHCIKTIVSN